MDFFKLNKLIDVYKRMVSSFLKGKQVFEFLS